MRLHSSLTPPCLQRSWAARWRFVLCVRGGYTGEARFAPLRRRAVSRNEAAPRVSDDAPISQQDDRGWPTSPARPVAFRHEPPCHLQSAGDARAAPVLASVLDLSRRLVRAGCRYAQWIGCGLDAVLGRQLVDRRCDVRPATSKAREALGCGCPPPWQATHWAPRGWSFEVGGMSPSGLTWRPSGR